MGGVEVAGLHDPLNIFKQTPHGYPGQMTSLPRRKSFFDFAVNDFDRYSLMQTIGDVVGSGEKAILLPMNADCFNLSRRRNDYRELLRSGRHPVYPDGAGVTFALALLGLGFQERLVTTDVVLYLLETISVGKLPWTITFLGGQDGIAKRARNKLNDKYAIDSIRCDIEPALIPWDEIRACQGPAFDSVVEALNENPTDIVFVGLGCPKQELFCQAILDRVPQKIFIPCGGLFAYYAGEHARAPLWMQRAGLEWLFRLSLEPNRLWKRYLIGNLEFVLRVLKEKGRLVLDG